MAISPNKQQLAAAGNLQIRLYELGSNNLQPTVFAGPNGHKGNVIAIGFFSSGRWIYSGSEDGTIKMWDVRNSANPRDFEKCEEPCTSLTLTPNEKYLISTYQNGLLRVIDHSSGAFKDYRPDGEKPLQSVSIDPSGKFCSVVNHQGDVMMYDIGNDPFQQFNLVTRWRAHNRYILKCLWSPDSTMLATASADHTVKIWNVKDFCLSKTLADHSRWVWDCTFSSQSNYLITASSDNSAKLWDLATGSVVRHFAGHRKAVSCVALSDSDSDTLV